MNDRRDGPAVAEEDVLRAETYALLGRLLLAAPKADLLADLGRLEGDDSAFGVTVAALAASARAASVPAVAAEYQALFIGISQGELQPYASYYLAGGIYRQPLADVRGDMARLGIARDESVNEPEDHIGTLCEIMAGLILGSFGGAPAPLSEQQLVFERHLGSWAPRFFADLEGAPSASFYMPVGRIGALFMEIERQGFELLG